MVRIFNKRSAEGISSSMFCLETVGTTMSLLFSVRNAFPFSTYGEAFFILAQNVAILVGACVAYLHCFLSLSVARTHAAACFALLIRHLGLRQEPLASHACPRSARRRGE